MMNDILLREDSPPPKSGTARLTVVETVAFECPTGEVPPTAAGSKFSRVLHGHEQPFVRWGQVGQEWTQVETGWLDDCGMLLLENAESATANQKLPTPEQRDTVTSRVIEVGQLLSRGEGRTMHSPPTPTGVVPFALVPVGESLRFLPSSLTGIHLRCRSDKARFKLTLIPV